MDARCFSNNRFYYLQAFVKKVILCEYFESKNLLLCQHLVIIAPLNFLDNNSQKHYYFIPLFVFN